MKLRPEQLAAHLQQELLPCYIVSGAEMLLVQECCDAIRQRCRQQAFSREVFHVESGFDWSDLLASANAMSLFSERQLIELRMGSGKPGEAGTKAILHYLEQPNPDNVLLVVCDKLDSSATRSKWYKALETTGASLQVWPVEATHLPRWLGNRLQKAGLRADNEAIQMLADRVEGNLLAAAQEIEKLTLYAQDGQVTVTLVENTVANSSRFDVFALADRALAGDARAAIKTLNGLRAEGVDANAVLWALARELRTLGQCAEQIGQGHGMDRVLQNAGVWDRRKPLVRSALNRLSVKKIHRLIQLASLTDRAGKGMVKDNPWHLLLQLVAAFAGTPLPLKHTG